MEIPEALKELLHREVTEGAQRIYDRGMGMFDEGERCENGGKLMVAAISDSAALYFRVLESATVSLAEGNPERCTHLLGVARDGLLKAVEAECEKLGRAATKVVGNRHVLELTVGSGVRYDQATTRAHELTIAATAYLSQLETLIHTAGNATTNE